MSHWENWIIEEQNIFYGHYLISHTSSTICAHCISYLFSNKLRKITIISINSSRSICTWNSKHDNVKITMNVQEVRPLCHAQNLNDSQSNIKWSSIISLRYHYFTTNSQSTWCTFLLTLAQFLQFSQTAAAHNITSDKLTCHSDSRYTCPYLLSPECW
jgi:hypothetical protein